MSDQVDIYKGPRSDEYETPPWIIEPLQKQYGFDCDLAATERNAKAPDFYTATDSFLDRQKWMGVAWCNPPFSLAAEFFDAIARQAFAGHSCVCIYKSSNMETKTWQHIFGECSWIAHPARRVNYLVDGVEAKGVQFASAVIGFNVEAPDVPWAHVLLRVDRGAVPGGKGRG